MSMAPARSTWVSTYSTVMTIDFLLPNGIMINKTVDSETTLLDLKSLVWQEARQEPLYRLLNDRSQYIFVGFTESMDSETFVDESRRLCDLCLVIYVLKVVLNEGKKIDNEINESISRSIGMSVLELNEYCDVDNEAMDSRRKLFDITETSYNETRNKSRTEYLYSATMDDEISVTLSNSLKDMEDIIIETYPYDKEINEFTKIYLNVPKKATVLQFIETVIATTRKTASDEDVVSLNCAKFVVKICCSQSYMFDQESSLLNYIYIQNCIAQNKPPILRIMKKCDLDKESKDIAAEFFIPSYVKQVITRQESNTNPMNGRPESIWKYSLNFEITIQKTFFPQIEKARSLNKEYRVKMGLYHGLEPLAPHQNSSGITISNPEVNYTMKYKIALNELPRATRLCSVLYEITDPKRKNGGVISPIGWSNIDLFDYRGVYMQGNKTMTFHPHDELYANAEDFNINGFGYQSDTGGNFKIAIHIKGIDGVAMYPSLHEIHTLATENLEDLKDGSTSKLISLFNRDPLSELSLQERDIIWNNRELCLKFQESLPLLAQSLKWSDRFQVAQFILLIRDWPYVKVPVALQLLNSTFKEPYLRSFAVASIENYITSKELGSYMLQLIQCLKFEPYLYNDLAKMLLRKSLQEPKLGAKFFWYLKSEMHQTFVRYRFGLILEAFCRGCGPLLPKLKEQSAALNKISSITEIVKVQREDDQTGKFQDLLKETELRKIIEDISSPLNCSEFLGKLVPNDCRIKMSKQRPLWLVWKNCDPLADRHISLHKLIFKHGDDLRQDMLTLQMIRIMDEIWKSEGLDLKLIPYGCLATGDNVGLIEVVQDAQTVMDVQKKRFTAATQMDSSQLLKWIYSNNPGLLADTAIDNFTKSCAGYCVATFVLGIRDRHPDNIMISKNGRLFHIDFGHFLNNKKKKFGINRERFPFVLTKDFICVIAKTSDRPHETEEIQKFMQLCRDAYKKLRAHSYLILTLFSMMLSSGLPELTRVEDLEYIRKTLAVEMNEKEALNYFNQKCSEAYSGSFTYNIDWFFHFIANRN